jgi:Fic family protein
MNCLGQWEKFLHDRSLPPLIQVALAHYQFEAIHPFLDGNGRAGRLLITLFLVERSILPTPLLYLSAFFEATRSDYYGALKGVSGRGDWVGWLHYFLNGVARQSEDAISRAERINAYLDKWRHKVSEVSSQIPLQLINLLGANPYLTTNRAAEQLKVAYTTAQRAIERLEKFSIISRTGSGKRNRVYCAKDLLKILEEPPKLRP